MSQDRGCPHLRKRPTTQAVHELFEHGIEMAILTRRGRLIGQITSPATKNINLRIHQFRKYDDESFRLNLGRVLVSGKIANCLQLLRNFSYNHPEIDLQVENVKLKSKLATITDTEGVEHLLGIEGDAARSYFQAFGKMLLSSEFTFPGRRKRPPTDPVNAILSLSYTMIFNEISSLLDGLGFDPYLGFLHKIDYGRASLAADLMEEFRAPAGDQLVLKCINNRMFSSDDFQTNPTSGGVAFKREALKRYFSEYENHLNREFIHAETGEKTTLRKCFRGQAERMMKTVQDDQTYTPFRIEQ